MGDSARYLNTVRMTVDNEVLRYFFIERPKVSWKHIECKLQKKSDGNMANNNVKYSNTFALESLIDFLHADFQIFSSQTKDYLGGVETPPR
jgi:hypothetical protein